MAIRLRIDNALTEECWFLENYIVKDGDGIFNDDGEVVDVDKFHKCFIPKHARTNGIVKPIDWESLENGKMHEFESCRELGEFLNERYLLFSDMVKSKTWDWPTINQRLGVDLIEDCLYFEMYLEYEYRD